MSVTSKVLNVATYANFNIDGAKDKVARLILFAGDPLNNVNPASIEKIEEVNALLIEADAQLADFATINGFTL